MQLVELAFLRQFRKEEIRLPIQDRRYRNTSLRYLSCSRKEKTRLERFLEKEMAHSSFIAALIAKIKKVDMDTSRQLSRHADKTLRLFAGLARKEPCTAMYCGQVSESLRHLLETVEINRDASRDGLQRLKALVAGKKTCPFEAGDLRNLQLVLRQYLDILGGHHEAFSALLDQETDAFDSGRLATRAGQSIFGLLALIEKEITSIESTAGEVEEWRKRLHNLVIQGIWN